MKTQNCVLISTIFKINAKGRIIIFILLFNMLQSDHYKDKILNINKSNFEDLAIEVFQYQSKNNLVYQEYLNHLKIDPKQIKSIQEIPFLPIEFYKSFNVICNKITPRLVFESSGTTGAKTSKHYIGDPDFYKEISKSIFETQYGDLKQYAILALLPSYLERGNSSLVFMVNHFMQYADIESGYFLKNLEELKEKVDTLKSKGKKILLIGVSFALLDLAEMGLDLSGDHHIVMETGGMKGKREEIIREELHQILKSGLNTQKIHSEYGMTELLSQFYAKKNGVFTFPNWARILLREVNDPLSPTFEVKSGAINIIDLANIDSCCFIETKDLGSYVEKGSSVKILGRLDQADIRGCNLLVNE
ncbi:hypothetical protein [Flexithrix dorotheae]|uniref:LuxE/PaaK family acyltransferase n=1 Tax=Flexithrix dorotheae TaxID=70993 RepID=UPI000362D2A8|nr:hypothetical protein [Flexithrix dorotheae]